jgi:hypothetical protein
MYGKTIENGPGPNTSKRIENATLEPFYIKVESSCI